MEKADERGRVGGGDDREKEVRKVTWTGLGINLSLAGLKFAAGFFGRSQALIADGLHSLTDTMTDVAVIAGSYYWTQPPDANHPYGHRRLETLVTVFIGLMLAAAGIGIGWEALATLHAKNNTPPGWIAVLAALVSIVCKEILYRWTAAVGRRVKSAALAANAWHHRTDAISSIPVLIAVAGARMYPSWSFLDRVGAAVVSLFILHAALRIIWPGLSELVDVGAPARIQKRIEDLALENSAVKQVHKIRTRFISASIQVDLHIVVDGFLTVREGHRIADDVRDRVVTGIDEVVDVIVHVDPLEAALGEANLP